MRTHQSYSLHKSPRSKITKPTAGGIKKFNKPEFVPNLQLGKLISKVAKGNPNTLRATKIYGSNSGIPTPKSKVDSGLHRLSHRKPFSSTKKTLELFAKTRTLTQPTISS